jgi:hypothetical protein
VLAAHRQHANEREHLVIVLRIASSLALRLGSFGRWLGLARLAVQGPRRLDRFALGVVLDRELKLDPAARTPRFKLG